MDDTVVWGLADDGALVEVQLTADAAEVDVVTWWPPMGLVRVSGPQPGTTAEASYQVVNNTAAAWDRLESDLGLFVAERLESLVAVHAAVIRAADVVVLVPGPSYAGKTSLCVAALDARYEVLSDEYALIDTTTGLVSGWPRLLRVRMPSGEAQRMGDVVHHDPIEVDLVAEVAFDADVDVLDVRHLSAAETTLALLGNTVCAASRPEVAFAATLAVGRKVAGVRGRRGHAAGALQALVDLARNPLAVP